MFFTQDDYLKIQGWLQRNSVRDTEFQAASLPLRGDEIAAIIQDGKNKKLLLKELKGQSSIKLVLDDEETFYLEGGHEAIIHDSRKQPLINIFEEAVQDNSLSKLSDTIHVVFTRNGITYRTFSSTKGEFGNDYNHIQLTCTSLYSKDNVFYVGVVYLYYTLGSSYISIDGFEESPINTENISLSLYRVVDSLPSKPDSDDINKIHLVKTSRTDENDRFDEYLWKGDTWELIGTLKNEIDLSSYYTKTESDKKYITQQKLDGELQPYDSRISKLETDINTKEDKGYGITDVSFDEDSYELQIDKTRDSSGVSAQAIVDLSSIKEDIKNAKPKLKTINGESLLGEGDIKVAADVDLSEYYTKTETDDLCDSKINSLNSEINDGDLVNVTVKQEIGEISAVTINETKLTNKIAELQSGIDTANQMIDNLDTKMEDYILIEGDSVKKGNFDIRGTLSLGTEAETYASIDDDGNADFTSLKIAGREVLPVVIPFSALRSDNGVTIWNKLQFALKNSVPLFISYWVSGSGSVQEYALFPINANYVGGGRYVISYTIPNYNSASNNIVSHTTHTIGIGDRGYLDNAWSMRTSLCAVPITQAEYDALTTKEDVLYVIKG